MEWWKSFFDEDYVEVWGHVNPPDQSEAEAEQLIELLQLTEGARVLDAPCGYGRISHALSRRGMEVVGVDLSQTLLRRAQEQAADEAKATFVRADLREPLSVRGFDAAVNLFSSIGYGSEEEDQRVLENTAAALRPGGLFFLDTMHRDAYSARRARGESYGMRGPNGLTIKERIAFDPIAGRIHSTWTWNSPTISGQKTSTMRLYAPTELVALLRRSGFEPISYHRGISIEPFGESDWDQRLGILARRAD
jgi:SAM-dependent methyltransferase